MWGAATRVTLPSPRKNHRAGHSQESPYRAGDAASGLGPKASPVGSRAGRLSLQTHGEGWGWWELGRRAQLCAKDLPTQ